MAIDAATRESLELTQTASGQRKGSLLDAVDRTVTGAGARALAGDIGAPLMDRDAIEARQRELDMREKLLEVLFDSEGRLQLERLESLLAVVENDESAVGAELLPVAGAGLKLLLGQEGRSIRERLLLTLVRDDRLNTDDLRGLLELLGRTFAPQRMVRRLRDQLFTRLNPLAA
jgi:hypothetical protein